MTIRVSIAGATGWAGSALAKAVHQQEDLELVSGISRSGAGQELGGLIGEPDIKALLSGTAQEALARLAERSTRGVMKGFTIVLWTRCNVPSCSRPPSCPK